MNKLLNTIVHGISACAFLLCASASSQAQVATRPEVTLGAQWLASQVKVDGSLASEPQSVATSLQVRTEVAQTLKLFGAIPSHLTDAISLETEDNTEYLSRQIIALVAAGQGGSTLNNTVSALVAKQNLNGGFGGALGYASNPLDTAWALLAFHASGQTTSVPTALDFLKSTQLANGSFSIAKNADPYTSAYVLAALQLYASSYPLNTTIESVTNYLVSQQTAPGVWNNSPWLTAIVYSALHNFIALEPTASAVKNYLVGSQQINGSWSGDPYGTALILRALSLSDIAPNNPTQATIQGKAVDAQTGQPLAGVTIALSGAMTGSTNTGTDGVFIFSSLTPGTYGFTISMPSYGTLTTSTIVKAGQTLDLGTTQLSKIQNATTGTVRGSIKDATTGQPLAGVTVTVTGLGASSLTDVTGIYQIANVPAGPVALQATKTGFATASASNTLSAGGILIFSPALSVVSTPLTSSTVQGTIIDAVTGMPLAGVAVTISGANSGNTVSNVQGVYSLAGLMPGMQTIVMQLAGYDMVTGSGILEKNSILTFSPKLYATATSPPDANKSGVTGIVIDAGTNAPIANASITLTVDGQVQNFASGTDGRFIVKGITGAKATIGYVMPSYQGATIEVVLQPMQMLDLGQVRLRLDKVEQLSPDLTVRSVSRASAVTDTQNLQVSGSVKAKIANIGTAAGSAGVEVIAFLDVNRNGIFNSDVDQILGRSTMPILDVKAEVDVTIPVRGTLPFRDAPIHVWVDSTQSVIETNENNNTSSTAVAAEIKPDIGTFEPVLKWHWKGSTLFPTHNSVEMAPVVMHTHDNNGDGKINAKDTPNIAFMTFNWNNWNAPGVFRIIDGRNGSDLVAVQNPNDIALSGWPSIAAADLNGDGLVDFLIPTQDGRLVSLNNNGQFNWVANLPTNNSMYYTFGGPNIVDLDGEGHPSILFGPYVLNSDGTLRWKAQGSNVGGQNSIDYGTIAADLDLDGYPEVIIGAQAYDRNGTLLWNNSIGDGLTAVGNFNSDPNPEVVLVSKGRVYLLDHLGKIIWGPVYLPGGGNGGPPTIADFNGDGKPGIGVAGAGMYTVFRADGSILWSTPVQDYSSSRTGSTVFDFDGNGTAEVVYSDETKLHIFNGSTGATVFEQPTKSSTAAEYPVVVDLDNDHHADLIVPASSGTHSGIRVFRDAHNSWVNTRSIWNQYAYHITNINDDGTVPRKELNSWKANNTYRLNARLGESATAVPDVTTSFIRISDHGGQTPSSITVRVGNASSLVLNAGVKVAFYNGPPASAGALIDTIATSRDLESGEFEDVTLSYAGSLSGVSTLTIVADDDGTGKNSLTDFDRSNNTVSKQLSALPGSFTLAVSTDKTSYSAGTDVQIMAPVSNHGSFDGSVRARFVIQSIDGVQVMTLPVQTVQVARGGQQSVVQTWNTGAIFAGPYQVKAQLIDDNDIPYAETSSAFSITSAIIALNANLSSDKQIYQPYDTVKLTDRLINMTSNVLLNDLQVTTSVRNPDGTQRFIKTESLIQLAQGHIKDYVYTLPLVMGASGVYSAELTVHSINGSLMAQTSTSFKVASSADAGSGLSGVITVAQKQVSQGDAVVFDFSATNKGNSALVDLPLKVSIVDPAAQKILAEFPYTQTLSVGGNYTAASNWVSTGASGAKYVAVLSAMVGGKTLTLAQDGFELTSARVKLDITQQASAWQNLLVYSACKRAADDVLGQCGAKTIPIESAASLASCDNTRATALNTYLNRLSVAHKVTSSPVEFLQNLRSGLYNSYWISNGATAMLEPTVSEVSAAVYRGHGLLIDGLSDSRNLQLTQCAGINYQGKYTVADQMLNITGDLLNPSTGNFRITALPVKLSAINGATAQAKLGTSPMTDGIISGLYGSGKTLTYSFDLAETLRAQTQESRWLALTQKSFGYLEPAITNSNQYSAGQIFTVVSKIKNEGQAAELQLSQTLPVGAQIIATEPAANQAGTTATWRLNLLANVEQEFKLRLRAPDTPGNASIVTTTSVIKDTVATVFKTQNFDIVVESADQLLTQLISRVTDLSLTTPEQLAAQRTILAELNRTKLALAATRFDEALRLLLTVQSRIKLIDSGGIQPSALAHLIGAVEWQRVK
ncbi:carboxypeptidase regulatory-like domain-containing protein [Undibacterium flavidum]|uniref:Carboxypeptidase regulatory-like domain-containing protein n=1 Tax=Undibacterium flavidum TaxID=2762297 RepID=A0ABR6YAW8_9BURK|nr:carboxypeptidase regulatory-like domain-containing protein [Undibacterium flavidum]MBC3873736.1 carboxypeptidase regulatory-like domain-containing protein [Undibacterium flavidum]